MRLALNPIVAALGPRLTYEIPDAPVVGFELALPDTGPLLPSALPNQDMLLAGAMIFIHCTLAIIGAFVPGEFPVLVDPRIRPA